MRVVASGVIHDSEHAPSNQRSASSTAVTVAADGTVLATCRLGTDREGPDGHSAVFASDDQGATWELRYLSPSPDFLDGVPGETRGWMIAELAAGRLTATVMWTDRSDPLKPWLNQQTQGLLPIRCFHTESSDGGRHWGTRRIIDLSPHPAASVTGPLISLPDRVLAQPFEYWKAYEDPSPGRPGAMLRLSADGGLTWNEDVTVARDPGNRVFYWDERLAAHPETGDLVAMFWTYDAVQERDVDIHIASSPPDGRRWSVPLGTGLPGQHCQPVAIGGDRLMAVYAHRREQPGIRAALSTDFGRSWDRSTEIEVWRSRAGPESGMQGPRAQADYWNDMGAWQFGHPRGALLPSGEVIVVFYGGQGMSRSARWARLAFE